MKRPLLHPFELFDIDPEGGLIRLGDQRFVLQNVAAMELMRREIEAAVGEQARPLLLRFGYAQGYFDALCASGRMSNMELAERFVFGAAMHTLQGSVRAGPVRAESDGRLVRVECLLFDGWEIRDRPNTACRSVGGTCWCTTGYASGFASGASKLNVLFRETECVASGAAACRFEGRDSASWPKDVEEEYGGGSALERVRREVAALFDAGLPRRPEDGGLLVLGSVGAALARRHNFIVRSRAMSDVLALAERVAPLETNVLIYGESGTGKEFLARFLHERSLRAKEPFVVVNCAALAESLLESELFGHVRGAFTGATHDKLGLLEHAGHGTVFLDEVGEMTAGMQSKLLRVLENREVRRVGATKSTKVSVRVVAATHRDLRKAAAEGVFREDLWFRLGAFVLTVPPLRERREDIAPLAHYFLRDIAGRLGKPVHSITAEAMGRLLRHAWPGNVRELRHAVEQAAIQTTSSTVGVREFPVGIGSPASARSRDLDGDLDVKANERALIEEALRRFGGNRARAAKALRMSPVTLWRKAKRLGLTGVRKR